MIFRCIVGKRNEFHTCLHVCFTFKNVQLFLPAPMMDGFSFYVVDVAKRTLLGINPAETSIHDDEMSVKHEGKANLVLRHFRESSVTTSQTGMFWRTAGASHMPTT